MSLILTDENFEKETQGIDNLVLVDFFATWCEPCFILTPILEKLANDFGGKFILTKADLDNVPLTAQKFGVEKIPTVILFKGGKPISGFVGLRPEAVIKEWLEKMIKENGKAPVASTNDRQEKIKELIREYTDYAQKNGFQLNSDKEIVERVINGLLENEKKYGKKYCPCRRITGNQEEDSKKICPCSYHRDEIKKDGYCFCRLFTK